jgi:hypothetical protein
MDTEVGTALSSDILKKADWQQRFRVTFCDGMAIRHELRTAGYAPRDPYAHACCPNFP